MKINIRQEQKKDYKHVFNLIEQAFKSEIYSDHKEQFLVERLRKSSAFIPELSLVAELEGEIVGHILLTKIHFKNEHSSHKSLALAPVSVLPDCQKQGIGALLINAVHEKAKALGYQSVILLGHEDYYPKFGYQQADNFGIDYRLR